MVRQLGYCLAVLLLGSSLTAAQERPRNVLLLIGDDVGVEQFAPFGIGSVPAVTPTLDALAERGMRFSHVWSQAMCSPTRATLLTGRYGFRTGVGSGVGGAPGVTGPWPEDPPLGPEALPEVHEDLRADVFPYLSVYERPREAGPPAAAHGLPPDELTLPGQLKRASTPYSTAVFGKWHLGSLQNGWLEHPNRAGFDHSSVLMLNEPESYFAWWENVNGELEERHGYTPEQKIDDALSWISSQGEQPWFVWLAFNLAHFPQHIPDVAHLDTQGINPEDSRAALDIMIARLDQEIGRLLAGLDEATLENTIVVFVGDNGTTGRSIDPPFHPDRAKFTVYEGGLRVPLIMAGPGVPEGRSSSALVNTTDIYSTLLEVAGAPIPDDRPIDGISLVPYLENPDRASIRQWLYADQFKTEQGPRGGGYAVRDERHKLITIRERVELYDLDSDLGETRNLLADGISASEQEILDRLQEIADVLHSSGP